MIKWVRGRLKWLVFAVLIAGATWFGYQRYAGPSVLVVPVSRRNVVQTVVASGRVEAPAEVNLGSQLAGVVRAVHVREGDRVAAGQLLVEFDDAEIAAQVGQARAALLQAAARVGQVRTVGARVADEAVRQAEANLRSAEDSMARLQRLFAAGAVAATDMENARRTLDVARSQVASAALTAAGSAPGGSDLRVAFAGRIQADAALRAAEARLAQTRVASPVSGVIKRRDVEPGDIVGPARTLLVLLRDGDTELSVTPDERNLAFLRLGQPALASAEAFPDRPFAAVVTYVAPSIDAQRGTVEIKLRVAAPPDYLRPEMTVSVEITVGRNENALVLPADAVRDAGTREAWVMLVGLGLDHRTTRRAVRIGLRGGNFMEVIAGLREGDAVVPASAGAGVAVGQRVRARRQ